MKLSFSAQVMNVSSKVDRTLKVVLNTQEMGKDAGELTVLTGQQVNVLFVGSNEAVREEDIPDAPEAIEEDSGISPAKRQRNLLWKIWETRGRPQKNFEVYYRLRMAQNEQKLKDELDSLTV